MTVEMRRRFLEDGRRVVEVVLPDGMDFDEAQSVINTADIRPSVTKVDPNQLVGGDMREVMRDGQFVTVATGIPLRLHIATQFMASFAGELSQNSAPAAARPILQIADALISAHNETCGEEK